MTRNYVMVGAGGTGAALFPFLTRYLETHARDVDEPYTLTIIDGKEVAPSKLERQLFFGRYAGDNKAAALAKQYESDPDVIIAVPEYLGDKNIEGIANGDVVLICADNYPVRARIEKRALELDDITVINGGNEMVDGSLQIFMRRAGENVTPPLSQGHPEILSDDGEDPSTLSCQQIAELPGGQQTILANMMSALAILNAVRQLHEWEHAITAHVDPSNPPNLRIPEEVFFDLDDFSMRATRRPEPTA